MRWIVFTYLVFLAVSSCNGRGRGKVRSCIKSSINKCAQKCFLYYSRRIRCSCYRGFLAPRRTPKDCRDVNECSTRNGRCQHICTNIPGGHHCSCRSGFRLAANQQSCVPQDPSIVCVEGSHQCQHFCNRTNTGHVCSCRRGYRLHSNGRDCIRLCAYGNGGCHHVCNTDGERVFCSCRPNFRLDEDGRTCRAHHTCAVDNGGCNAECEDTPAGVQCSCRSGYLLRSDRRTCQDVDECLNNNGGCQQGCRNRQGSYICTCPTGYKLAPDERTCVDIDECIFNDTCWFGCTNTPGSYECTCPRGLQKFSLKRCGDVNECTVNNGGCAHNCINTVGGYYCSCSPGYKLHWNEKDCVRDTRCPIFLGGFLKCRRKNCVLDCGTTSSFHSYHHSDRPNYQYVCGRPEKAPTTSRRGRRIQVTARPMWWGNNLEVNDTLRDCANYHRGEYNKQFSLKTDHCHLLRTSSGLTLPRKHLKVFLNYFSIKCHSHKRRKRVRTRLFVSVSFSIALSRDCNSKCRKRKGGRALNFLKSSMKKQLFRLSFNNAQMQLRRKTAVKRAAVPGILSSTGCLLGSVRSGTTNCSLCEPGSFFSSTTSTCETCPPGFYQDKRGQLACISCPRNSNLATQSYVSVTQCPGACPPGYYSGDGFTPCSPCPQGSYQPESGRIGCYSCGRGLTTRSAGAQTFSSCLLRTLCTAGHFYNTHTSSCGRCPVGYYQPHQGQNFCISCPGNTTTDYDASDSLESCKDVRCGGVIGELHGVIESPNYPGNYPINAHCTWVIKAPKNRKILLVIPEIFLPGRNCEDSLIMKSKKGPDPGKVTYQSCQTFANPIAIAARTKKLIVQFRSNDATGAKGFQIPYVTYDENYDAIIQDIVKDYRLCSPNFHQNILKDKLSRQTLFDVLAKPETYFSLTPQITNGLFPSSFVAFLEQKVRKFFSH